MFWGFPCGSDAKESACGAGDPASFPGSGRSPEEGNDYPLHHSCEEFHGQRSLAGYSPWGHKESNMTVQLTQNVFYRHVWCVERQGRIDFSQRCLLCVMKSASLVT